MTSATLDNPGKAVLSPYKLAHVVLRTNNFDAMPSFYKTFLGGHAIFENEMLSFQTYDEEDHRIGIMAMPGVGPKNPATSGLEHISFCYRSLTELATSYLQRKANGIEPFWCVNHGPSTSVYYKDPDGNVLETEVENFESVEQSIAFVGSEAYQINPIGVDFDMEELIAKLKRGDDETELKKRPASGPRGPDSVPQ
ncbi:hypothetical protein M409DRAFT_29640 [Zasmidium cellare ATCC 36951]|uniref:VOC domain-containing protein n=1 Tax=Zasmidium cellare ATCC 36951 TaxID=1080233 RepID=A0A6A6C0Z3_ZASCE|nr:uncharacterized protein M409DRAFT_29640 [Zasmidium cellare ATCC 36951]KAF2159830.1 hypothetical protein M409DRAFT_29640 [Zasmidium cellare ATCC 36951]